MQPPRELHQAPEGVCAWHAQTALVCPAHAPGQREADGVVAWGNYSEESSYATTGRNAPSAAPAHQQASAAAASHAAGASVLLSNMSRTEASGIWDGLPCVKLVCV